MRVGAEAAEQPKLAVLLRQLLATHTTHARLSAVSDISSPGRICADTNSAEHQSQTRGQACVWAIMTPDRFRRRGAVVTWPQKRAWLRSPLASTDRSAAWALRQRCSRLHRVSSSSLDGGGAGFFPCSSAQCHRTVVTQTAVFET